MRLSTGTVTILVSQRLVSLFISIPLGPVPPDGGRVRGHEGSTELQKPMRVWTRVRYFDGVDGFRSVVMKLRNNFRVTGGFYFCSGEGVIWGKVE